MGDQAQAKNTLDTIRDFYRDTIAENGYLDDRREVLLENLFDSYQERLDTYVQGASILPEETNDYMIDGISFLGAGEIITTNLYRSILFPESDTGSIDPANMDDYALIPLLFEGHSTVISPGYYAGLPGGIIRSWGRGYSDATAMRIYEHLKGLHPEWKLTLAIRKVYPICSADPRRIPKERVKKLDHISLKLLLEMIGTHGASSQFVNQNAANIDFFEKGGILQIYTESDPVGSIVSLSGEAGKSGFLFVQSKSLHIFTITSYQFNTPGYTEYIYHFFREKNISIDNIVTSQTEISITIAEKELPSFDRVDFSEAFLAYLRKFETGSSLSPSLTIEDHSNLYIGGENIDFPGSLSRITSILQEQQINITLIMQPIHPQVIIIGVKKSDEIRALNCLHRGLIESD